MAEQSSGSSIGAIAGIALILVAPVFIVIFMITGASASAQPNPNGATTPQKINPNPATSPLAAQLADFDRFKDASGYLNQNSTLLTDLQTRLSVISATLSSGGGKGIAPANIVTLQTKVFPALLADINTIQGQVAAGTAQNAAAAVTDLISNLNQLELLSQNATAPGVVAVAEQIVNANNDGHGSITYPSGDGQQRINGAGGQPVQLDCSGFVSYVLQKTGIFGPAESPNTTAFAQNYTNDSRILTVESQIGGQISEADVLSKAQPGDLLISNTGDSVTSNSNNNNHVVIYLGAVNGVPMVAESTTTASTGASGPQYATLDNRVTHGGHIQLILRPIGVAAAQ